jgi:hypothetical protein
VDFGGTWWVGLFLFRCQGKKRHLFEAHPSSARVIFFFYFNIQMALIARVADFSKVRHHSQSSHQVELFLASICSGERMAKSHVECQSIFSPLQSVGNLLLLQREAITTSNYAKCGGCRQCGVKMTLSLKGGPPRPVSLVSFFWGLPL